MSSSISTPVNDLSQVGEARRSARKVCAELNANETFAGRVALVITELARNLVLHAGGGQIVLHEVREGPNAGVEILALDRGPGMRNVGECLRDGFSTAGTPGTGLGAIRRIADVFDLSTAEGRGTAICARLFTSKEDHEATWSYGGVNVPVLGEEICGDAWAIQESEEKVRVVVADGLGHGPYAADASQEAVSVFRETAECAPGEVLRRMDAALTKTRGAAAAVVEICPKTAQIVVAGAGNVVVRIFDREGKSKQIASVNGTVGGRVHKIQEFVGTWSPESLLVMHTDGLTAHWDLGVYPGLLQRLPATIAGILYRDYARKRDDATVVTLSCHR